VFLSVIEIYHFSIESQGFSIGDFWGSVGFEPVKREKPALGTL
jgi:hypothetical protein